MEQRQKVLSLRGRVNSSEEGRRGHQVDLVKSKAKISSLEYENKSLADRMLVMSKKNLESKCVKQDKDFRESTEFSNRLSQCNAKFERMLSMGKSVGD
ncbi:unnamed protein product [Ilex paraguariensis]|uniref:Uncharacterized protein n=1 Tax=Ilex paraguariensis TaxID=185542 RepID=A0ABC8RHY3_9AQUA